MRPLADLHKPSNPAAVPAGSASLSHKTLARYGRLKSAYKVPHSARKQTKYVNFLATLLSLSPGQQAEAASLFASASTAEAELKTTAKTHRKSLGTSVGANDIAGIERASLELGKLAAQRHSIGAKAKMPLSSRFSTLTSRKR